MISKLKNLSIEVAVAVFGHRIELDIVPFQFARPQFGFAPTLGREKRLPSFKVGPFHCWMMLTDKVEISFGIDTKGYFHSTQFKAVYDNSIIWPQYKTGEK